MDLRPFDESEDIEEEPTGAARAKVCNVGVSRVTDPSSKATAEGARSSCEERAEDVLIQCEYEERAPTTQDMEFILENWIGHPNRHRGKAMPKDKTSMESDAFGLVKSLSCIDPIIARNTRNYPCMVMAINLWMKSQCSEKKTFSWSTFTINRAWMSERHRDTNNVGPSAIASFGNHRGANSDGGQMTIQEE